MGNQFFFDMPAPCSDLSRDHVTRSVSPMGFIFAFMNRSIIYILRCISTTLLAPSFLPFHTSIHNVCFLCQFAFTRSRKPRNSIVRYSFFFNEPLFATACPPLPPETRPICGGTGSGLWTSPLLTAMTPLGVHRRSTMRVLFTMVAPSM